jgi:hypothetical protein
MVAVGIYMVINEGSGPGDMTALIKGGLIIFISIMVVAVILSMFPPMQGITVVLLHSLPYHALKGRDFLFR